MRMTIGVAYYNNPENLKRFFKNLLETTSFIDELIIVDNGSDPEYALYEILVNSKNIGDFTIIRNKENLGLTKAYNQIYKKSTGDWIAILHNDITIHEQNWDLRVKEEIKKESANHKIGLVGFGGGRGIGKDGSRLCFMSNLLNAEGHGIRIEKTTPAAIIEGSVLICNRKMLDATGGFFDCDNFHYVYDYDISMSSINAGFLNMVVPVKLDHICGITYLNKRFASEHPKTQEINDHAWKNWNERWLDTGKLPYLITEDWEELGDVEEIIKCLNK